MGSQSQVPIQGTPGSGMIFQPYTNYIQAYRQEHSTTENAFTLRYWRICQNPGIALHRLWPIRRADCRYVSVKIPELLFADSDPFLPTAVFCNRTTQTSLVKPIFHHLHVASQTMTYHHIFRLICASTTQHCDFVACYIYKYHTLEVIGEANDTGSMEGSILSQTLPS